MTDLVQTVSNIVGILMALVGVLGVGFFIYGSFLYMTAGGAPHQMERAKSAMFTALAAWCWRWWPTAWWSSSSTRPSAAR